MQCRERYRLRLLLAIGLLSSTIVGCHARPSDVAQKFTSGTIAISNLNAQLHGYRHHWQTHANLLSSATKLVDTLLFRAHFLGTVADFDEAETVATAAVNAHRNTASAYELRARVRRAVHRFEEALDDIRQAEALGANSEAAQRWYDKVLVAQGKSLSRILKARQRAFRTNPSYITATETAIVLGENGAFQEADQLYARAIELYRDAAPFPIAWVAFQRGLLWAEKAGQPDKARPHYQEAVRLLPDYVAANIHLAELQASAGETEKALGRLHRLGPNHSHPEVSATLATLLASTGHHEEAAQYRQQTHARYGQLLTRHRLAFLDHAAEFYYRSGKAPKQALQLATENLQHRQTGRSYELALQAANAAGEMAQLCHLRQAALSHQPKQLPLIHLVQQTQHQCKTTDI